MSKNVNDTAAEVQAEETKEKSIFEKAKEVQTDPAENALLSRFDDIVESRGTIDGKEIDLTEDEEALLKSIEDKYNSNVAVRSCEVAFEAIYRELKAYVNSLDSHKTTIDKARSKSETYSQKYILKLIEESGSEFIGKGKVAAEEVERALNDIKLQLVAKSKILPLGSGKFDTTVALLNTAGKNITTETIEQIGEEYRGDVASLRAFNSILENQGIKNAFKDLIFDADAEIGKLQIESAFKVFSGIEHLTALSKNTTAAFELARDINQAKFDVIRFGKNIDRLVYLANVEVMPWRKEIIPKDEVFGIALRSGAGV